MKTLSNMVVLSLATVLLAVITIDLSCAPSRQRPPYARPTAEERKNLAYSQGREDFQAGIRRITNRYVDDSPEGQAWFAGWNDASRGLPDHGVR